MGYRVENDCVGCERCIHCSRGKDYKQYFCDECKADENKDLPMFRYGNKDLCFDCYVKQFHEKVLDECDDQVCCDCHNEVEYLYEAEKGEWVCIECLEARAERVDTE